MARRGVAALALAVVVAACGSAPGAKDDEAKKSTTPAATVDAKPDISKVGDVTLRPEVFGVRAHPVRHPETGAVQLLEGRIERPSLLALWRTARRVWRRTGASAMVRRWRRGTGA